MKKKVIISLHGIRTRGSWQKDLCPFISERGWKYYPLDYGYFTSLQLLCPWAHDRKARWFRDRYNQIVAENPGIRPSIVVHSFGSLILAKSLENYTDLKFDKVILTGSIVRKNYPWDTILERGQCSALLNIICAKDFPVKLAQWFVWGAGNSGGAGFENREKIEEFCYEKLGHSGSHSADVYSGQVVPFLSKPSSLPDGSASENYLAMVSPFDAACWAALTYKRQFLDRFQSALRGGYFQPRKEGDPPLPCSPKGLVILIPNSASDASEDGRESLIRELGFRTFGFGQTNERTALMDDEGRAFDLPSILESFKVFDDVYGNRAAVEECLNHFEAILSHLTSDPKSLLPSVFSIQPLEEELKERSQDV